MQTSGAETVTGTIHTVASGRAAREGVRKPARFRDTTLHTSSDDKSSEDDSDTQSGDIIG